MKTAKLSGHQLLAVWVNDQRLDRDFTVGKFCKAVGVTTRACWLWRQGTYVPKERYRPIIEKVTKGAVPASAWAQP
jgi:hypothetical protein